MSGCVLTDVDVERVARRTVALLHEERLPEGRLLTATELAAWLGVDPSWAYRHADRLSALRVGDGPRPRLRFDRERVREALATARSDGETSAAQMPKQRRASRQARAGLTAAGNPLLPVRGGQS